ncbi:rhomboid family intramembrane serine protease [Pelagicoccus sp. SDUM812002]|uniref:rhomboid family intramembrane serine protease n=1 Tax=Pelagicoccus sp. SDUM812002 TaxID=3041266 RepID=UPI00280DDE39|nr:rhomboid family intramembrane serine protease [Pelagicoccus sp. SDUM812002]MDQ8183986.1 rhomboid family intramembrane serine protease [Pelagicoccus sp. SDUM812002]
MEDEEEALAVIGSYRTARQAHEAGLSVLACGHPYWVRIVEGRFLLVVMSDRAEKLKREIDMTAAKNRFWPPRALDLSAPSLSKWPTIAFMLMLALVFGFQYEYPSIVTSGLNSSEGLEAGECWRILTAVTLHSDIGHLAGNLLGLSVFAYLSCRYMGNGLGWAVILAAACLANLSNAWLRSGEDFSSLGASTAVFAALGLLAGYPVGSYLRAKVEIQARDWLLPFFGACVAFAWMGGGEFPTDVPGHFWAFGYGSALGLVVAWSGVARRLNPWVQALLLSIAWGSLAFCWLLALSGF